MFPEGGWEKKGRKRKKETPKHLSSSPLYTKSPVQILLEINKTAAFPPSNFVAKQFVEGKGWNLDIPFSCFRNLRTLNLVGFEIDRIN